MARRERNLKVEVPKPEQERAEFGKVGIIAAVGFAIGIAWPWLAGVRLVPSPPSDEGDPAPAASVAASASAGSAASSMPAPESSAAPPSRTADETVKIGEGQVVGCREGKKKLKDCDRVAFDAIAKPKLSTLATCTAGKGKNLILSIGFELDFEEKRVADVFAGKSTTFSKEETHELLECAKKEFDGVRLDGIDHEHPRYTVFYFVQFVPPGTILDAAQLEQQTAEASGLATVQWDVAVVRDQPEDGKIVARLRYGTRAVVTARRGKWYQIKYDAKGSLGWVHQNAIGL